jgi:hypothetical protein
MTAALIAAAMGEGWSVDDDPRFAEYPGAYLMGPDDVRIYLRFEPHGHKGKVAVHTAFPDSYRRVYTSDIPDLTIYVGKDRGPDVIAKEIKRRFLPDYLPALALIRERVAEHEAGERESARVCALLAAIPGWSEHGETFYGPHGMRIDVRWGGSINFERGSLPVELGLAVATLISEKRTDK